MRQNYSVQIIQSKNEGESSSPQLSENREEDDLEIPAFLRRQKIMSLEK